MPQLQSPPSLTNLTFGHPSPPPNRLFHGDNLAAMAAVDVAAVDLIYLDPPFFSGRRYADTAGRAAYSDLWPEGLAGYLAWLVARLEACRRLLTPGGTLVVHLDRRAVHYVKVELDRLFGPEACINEIIWHYTGGGRSKRQFSHKHDTLLWYRNGPAWTYNLDAVRQPYKPSSGYARGGITSAAGKRYLPHPNGTPADDVWDIPIVNPLSAERTGYPTQKPEALLERIIAAATNPGDLVADFFVGSGTTVAVAQRLGRRWIGCDQSARAIEVTLERLQRQAATATVAIPDIVVARV